MVAQSSPTLLVGTGPNENGQDVRLLASVAVPGRHGRADARAGAAHGSPVGGRGMRTTALAMFDPGGVA
jgi:hypothetical protein